MKILEISGTPFEMGKQHGEGAREEILHSLKSYQALFQNEVGLDWDEATKKAETYLPVIKTINQELIEEMEGVASGAKVNFLDVLALNARSEIALTHNKSDGCTSLGVVPPLSDSTYLAQNWDWVDSQKNGLVMLKMKPKHAPDIHMVTEAGIIGKIGINEYGVGVCLNAIRADIEKIGLPLHLGLRQVLNSKSAEDAVTKVTSKVLGSSANYIIGEPFNVMNLELTPIKESMKEARDFVYHTNHLCSVDLVEDVGLQKQAREENSFLRQDRAGEMLHRFKDSKTLITRKHLLEILSDHENSPMSICRHRDESVSSYKDVVTVFGVIMDLQNKDMSVFEGTPCNPKETYYFKF